MLALALKQAIVEYGNKSLWPGDYYELYGRICVAISRNGPFLVDSAIVKSLDDREFGLAIRALLYCGRIHERHISALEATRGSIEPNHFFSQASNDELGALARKEFPTTASLQASVKYMRSDE